ncbi:MAG: response regulator [Anaerolineales bacterium]
MPEKVLLVDDDIDTLRLVGLMLQRQGYQILAANNGAQALSIAEKEQPDIILLDIMMPEMDGFEVTRRLRENPITNPIPIIIFSAKNQTEDKLMGFEAGADDYLTKPTQPRELFAHIRAVLARVQKSQPKVKTEEASKGVRIGVLGVKGGVGTSTLTLNLGLAIQKLSEKDVIISDFRLGKGTIGIELGYTKLNAFQKLIQKQDFELNASDLEKTLLKYSSGISLLLSSSEISEAKLPATSAHFLKISSLLSGLADVTLHDLGAGYNPLFSQLYPECDFLILVFDPSFAAIQMEILFIDEFLNMGISQNRIIPVLYNRMRADVMFTRSQIQEKIKLPIAEMFTPAPELAHHAILSNQPIYLHQPQSVTAQQFNELAKKILSSI